VTSQEGLYSMELFNIYDYHFIMCIFNKMYSALHIYLLGNYNHYLYYFFQYKTKKSRGSSVGIALGYGLDDRGSWVRFPEGAGNFSFITVSRTALEPTQPPIQWVPGTLSLGVKRLGCETDHSPPSSAEVKNAWSYTSTAPIRLHGIVLG
jgi:hypothetical protein